MTIAPALTGTQSCLAHQFAKRGMLTREDVETLEDLEREPIHVKAGERLREQGRPFTDVILVREGWAASHYEVGDGTRQVVHLHVSGDLAGLQDVAFDHAITTTVALTDCAICRLPRKRIMDLIARSPRVTAILLMLQMQEEAVLVERLVSVGSRSAIRRTAHLLLELDRRRAAAGGDPVPHIPLSQRQIADCLGLTDVHVNRCMRRLKQAGAIAVGRNRITVLDEAALDRFARFDGAFLEPSLSNLGATPQVALTV
jgi:CRP/FNR family transcriptional regulator